MLHCRPPWKPLEGGRWKSGSKNPFSVQDLCSLGTARLRQRAGAVLAPPPSPEPGETRGDRTSGASLGSQLSLGPQVSSSFRKNFSSKFPFC